MATLNGRDISESFKDLLRFENAGAGLPADGNVFVQVEDGDGNTIPVRVSRDKFDIISGFMLGGVSVTATATQLNSLVNFLTTIDGNSTDIKVSRSDTPGLPGTLVEGQFHLNLDTGEFYYGDESQVVQMLKLDGANLLGTVPVSRLPSDVPLRNGTLQTNLNAEQWNGHKVIVQTTAPTNLDGDDGDFCFVYTP